MTFPEASKVQSLLIPETGWIHDFVSAYQDVVEAPPEALAGMAYTLLSTAVGWRSHLQWADSREPLTLFTVLVGGSASAHKTTILRIGAGIAKDANTLYREMVGAEEGDIDLCKVVSGGHTSQAGLLSKIAPETQEIADQWDRELPPGILVEWDELGDLVVDRGGYSFLSETRQMLLRLYGGFQPGSATLANPIPASRCAVSLVGTITTDEWQERLSVGAVTGGMMGRMFAIPTGKAPKWHPRPTQVDVTARNRLVDWLASLGANHQKHFGAFGFTKDAGEFWDNWYIEHKDSIEALNEMDPVVAKARGTIFNRYQAIAQKFAGLYAISQWDMNPRTAPRPIADLDAIRSACEYTDLALEQTSRIAVDVLEEADERFTRKVLESLTEQHGKPMLITDLQKKVRIRGIDTAKWHRYLELMEYLDLVSRTRETRNTPTGERTRTYVTLNG